jgi:hypothetical protein
MPDEGKIMKLLMISAAIAGIAAAPALGGDKPVDTTAAAIVADCNARKFETKAEIEKDGEKHIVKIKLCAAKDEDAAAWVKTLQDAKAKIADHPEISQDSKARITAELAAEIARVEAGGGSSTTTGVAPAPTATPLPEPAASTSVSTAPAAIAEPAPALAQTPARPRLTIRCLEQGERGEGGSCTGLERFTRLVIQADSDLVEGASLRFLRRGEMRGEVVLARMRQGQSTQVNLPPKVCAGVASSKVEIQILGSNKVVETLGPYLLRC